MRRAITLCTEVYIARTLVGIIITIIVIVISSDACAVIVNFDRRKSASKPNPVRSLDGSPLIGAQISVSE